MDSNEKEILIRCLANCDDIDKLLDIDWKDRKLEQIEINRCNSKIKELISSLVIFSNMPTTTH
jgi:hypothetical protein